jgi:pSer/pThr/pTyr-binding forkhead associated (FHA) protein
MRQADNAHWLRRAPDIIFSRQGLSARLMPRIALKDLDTDKARAVPDLEATLGRDPASSFVIDGPKSKVVSGRHARIFFQDNAWWIEDTSRNGTVLDDERLQAGQRHAIRVGQVVGLGESGPRFRVAVLESRKVAETVLELPDLDQPSASAPPIETAAREPLAPPRSVTAPRKAATPDTRKHEPEALESTTAMRRSEAQRAGLRFEEPTVPMSPAPDWLVKITLRATNANQQFDVTAMVVKIGRSPECNVQVPPELGASVSRLHGEILIADGGVVVRDAGSRNGTFLNGKRLEAPESATKGDLIMLGSGGPTFAIEDLHIVKGQEPQVVQAPGGERTPAEPKSAKRKGMAEPSTDPTPLPLPQEKAAGGMNKIMSTAPGLEDLSEQGARRIRILMWTGVGVVLLLAGGFFLWLK